MSEEKKHPMQPVITDNGVRRFKRNEIVDFIVMNGSINLNDIAAMNFSDEDRQQFAQLIGYSVSGYCEFPYVDDDAYNAAVDSERNSSALAASQPPEQPKVPSDAEKLDKVVKLFNEYEDFMKYRDDLSGMLKYAELSGFVKSLAAPQPKEGS